MAEAPSVSPRVFDLARPMPEAALRRAPRPPGDASYKPALRTLLLAVCVGLVSFGLLLVVKRDWIGGVGFSLAALIALYGALRALLALYRSATQVEAVKPRPVLLASAVLLGNLAMVFVGALSALLSTVSFTRGRQLRAYGRILLPRTQRIANEVPQPAALLPAPEALRGPLAAQWRENARTEYASVAAFARLSLDLIALGAPMKLVRDAHADAQDELRHTELCFGLASAFDGESVSPSAFPEAASARTLPGERSLALALLAVDSLVDGALNEGVSAYVVAELARRCPQPAIRDVLKEIARDEGRHAAHGWDVVEYCVEQGGAPVLSALRGALRVLPKTLRASTERAAHAGDWEVHGIPGRALEAEAMAHTRASLVRKLAALGITAVS